MVNHHRVIELVPDKMRGFSNACCITECCEAATHKVQALETVVKGWKDTQMIVCEHHADILRTQFEFAKWFDIGD